MFEELEHCELGTKEYWDNRYRDEVKNYKKHGDVGEIWFGEDIVDRIIKWMNRTKVHKASKLLDVGCGNGMLLIELFNEGYKNLIGVDYSENAIKLAEEIATKFQCDIKYSQCNILENTMDSNEFDIILDKGTYDAISLSEDAASNRNVYINNISTFLKDSGVLILTSCNWTKEELMEQYKERFVLSDSIPTPEFKFGGKVGNVVTSVVFKKVK